MFVLFYLSGYYESCVVGVSIVQATIGKEKIKINAMSIAQSL